MEVVDNCSIVIPVYNSESSLGILIDQLDQDLSTMCKEFEIILVNDGSCDGSWEAINNLVNDHPWVHGINLMRNYGQHNALLCGIRAAKYPITVTMDDDLQHPPSQIRLLLDKLDEGYSVVYGTPINEQHGIWRDLSSQITKLVLQGAMGAQTARKVSAFRVFRTELRNSFASYNGSFVSIDVLLTWGTTNFASIPVQHDPRRIGVSNYSLKKLVTHAINLMTGFSTLPLQFASLSGFFFAFTGMIVLFYVVGRYLIQGGSVQGFPFLASTIAIFSGAQLFALGIIGEYLARMHFRLMDKPSYTVLGKADISLKAMTTKG